MKKNSAPIRQLAIFIITALVISSCDPVLDPPFQVGLVQDCQITSFLYVGTIAYTESGINEGFPEVRSSPLQGDAGGFSVWGFNSANNPGLLRQLASTRWEDLTLVYNPDKTIKSITHNAAGNETFCLFDTCQKVFVFSYDANGNPQKISGEVRDRNGNLLSGFPVCDNEFDMEHRLTKQNYPDQHYWRFEYKDGNLFRMYYKDLKETNEQLVYEFKSYDTKMNFAKTNPFWQIYYNTYSNNNPLSYRHFTGRKITLPTGGQIDEFIDVNVKYTYGSNYGKLPTEIEFDDADTGLPFYPDFSKSYLTYQCKPIINP